MRKMLLMAALCMAAVLVFAQVAVAQTRGPSGADGTFNCEDFDFQEDAQEVFDEDTSDPNGLDGPIGEGFTGEEGVACEELPNRGTGTDLPEEPVAETPVEPDDVQYGADDVQYGGGGAVVEDEEDVVVLPDTGGPSLAAFALPTLALLVAGGIFAARMVRR